MQTHRQTSLVPESQICQRCAGRSCRFPVALVSRRSYSQSTQTHHSRHPLHSPGSAGSQLERENRLGEGLYHLSTADSAADCYRRVGNDTARKAQLHINTDCCANHKAEPFPQAQAVFRVFMTYSQREKGMQGESGGLHAEEHLVADITVSFCTAIHLHCLALGWDGALQIHGK